MDYSQFSGTPEDYLGQDGGVFWYKITIDHGPGHQSRDVFYQFSDCALDDEQKRDMFKSYWEQFTNSAGEVELIDRLPEDVRVEKIEDCEDAIESAQRMLNILHNLS